METPFHHSTWAVAWHGGNSASLGSSHPFFSGPLLPLGGGIWQGKVRCCCPYPSAKPDTPSEDRIIFHMMEVNILICESLDHRATGNRGRELVPHPAKVPSPPPPPPHSHHQGICQWFGFLPVSPAAQQAFPAIPHISRRRPSLAEADVPRAACITVIIK